MANRRMISKSICTSKKIKKVYDIAHERKDEHPLLPVLLFTWLQPHVDDWGRFDADPFTLKYNIFPTFNTVNESHVFKALKRLQEVKLIELYIVDDNKCLQIIKFEEHQAGLNRRTKSKYPTPPSEKFQEVLGSSEKFPSNRIEGKGIEQNRTIIKNDTTVFNEPEA